MITDNLKSFFSFSKKELNGLLVFSVLLIAITFAPALYRRMHQPEVFSFDEFKNDIKIFKASAKVQSPYSYNKLKEEAESKELEPLYFEFDPNNLQEESWSRLGLSSRQIKVIKNYESKGGKFYRKEDLQKIYSISKEEYALLEPYIKLPERFTKESAPKAGLSNIIAEKAVKAVIMVELNAADSIQLETIRGIGPAFASRIIKYRSRLGGFHSKEQLKEVYGIDAVKYEQLKDQVRVDAAEFQRININTMVFDDLKRNPYLSFKQINALLQYRKQHGAYKSTDDLKKVVLLDADVINKIEPYLIF